MVSSPRQSTEIKANEQYPVTKRKQILLCPLKDPEVISITYFTLQGAANSNSHKHRTLFSFSHVIALAATKLPCFSETPREKT